MPDVPSFDPRLLSGLRILDVSRALDRCAPYPGDPEYRREVVSGQGEPPVSRLTLCAHSGTHVDAPGHVLPGGAALDGLALSRFVLPALVARVGQGGLVGRGALEAAVAAALEAAGLGVLEAARETAREGEAAPSDRDACEDIHEEAPADPTLDRGRGPAISAALKGLKGHAVLIRTANSDNPRLARGEFDPGYAALSVEAAELLAESGAALVGVDGPGVDPYVHAEPHPDDGRADCEKDALDPDDPDMADPGLAAHRILLGAGAVLLENLDLSGVEPGLYGLVCLPLALDAGAEASPVRAVLLARPLAP